MLIPSAYAQTAGSAAPAGGAAGMIQLFAPFALIFVAFYFLMLRPQQKRQRAFQASLDAVKKGDQVVTGGGIAGRVTRIEDRFVEVEIAPNVRVRCIKTTLTEVGQPIAKPAND